jgi:hypothetical protein
MRTKAGLGKMARDRNEMADRCNHNINQRNRKQKQSAEDALELGTQRTGGMQFTDTDMGRVDRHTNCASWRK